MNAISRRLRKLEDRLGLVDTEEVRRAREWSKLCGDALQPRRHGVSGGTRQVTTMHQTQAGTRISRV